MSTATRQKGNRAPKNISIKRIESALRKNGGIHTAAARVLGVDRSAISQRVASQPSLQRAISEGKSQMIDLAEDNVFRALKRGDPTMTRWCLELKGRDRGYGRVQHEDVTQTPIDPLLEARRALIVATFVKMVEDRARAGLPPIMVDDLMDVAPMKERP